MKTNTPFRARCVIAFLLSGLVIMTIAASPASGVGKAEREKALQRNAQESAGKLQRLARELLGEDGFQQALQGEYDDFDHPPPVLTRQLSGVDYIQAANEYILAFPRSQGGLKRVFGYVRSQYEGMVRVRDGGPGFLSEHGRAYISLFFELFEYADRREFIRKAVGVTVDADWYQDEHIDDYYAWQLRRHFNKHFDDYLEHLAGDREAVLAFLRFPTLEWPQIDTSHDSLFHAMVDYGMEPCLDDTRAMRLCTAAELVNIPLFDDIVALLECGESGKANCTDAAGGSAFQTKLTGWAKSNLHLIGPAFKPGSKDAINYLPVFYMMKRHLADKFRELLPPRLLRDTSPRKVDIADKLLDLPFLEAELYINHPTLSMRWLDKHPQDMKRARRLGMELFCPPASGGYYHDEARRLRKALIGRFREYLTAGENMEGGTLFPIYKVDGALFTNNKDVGVLLKHWERAEPRGRARSPYEFCKEQEQQRQQ